jgi:hypothetical protein
VELRAEWVTLAEKDGDRVDIRVSEIKSLRELKDPRAKTSVVYGRDQCVWVTQTVAEVRALIELSAGRE